jgi:SAM-dependent methyltransferase
MITSLAVDGLRRLQRETARARRLAKTTARRSTVRALTVAGEGPLKPLSDAAMRRLFNQVAGDWEAIRAEPAYRENFREGLRRHPAMREVWEDGAAPPEHVLDVACGTGLAASVIVQELPDAQVIGIDIAERMVALAEEHVPEAVFVAGSSEDLPFADDSFDLVCSLDGVFSIPELVRVCRSGGWIYIAYTHEDIPIRKPLERLSWELERAGAQTWFGSGPGEYVWAQV